MNIAIVGSGYVGLVAASCFAELGHDVICVDEDKQKIAALQRGECPIHEQFLPELLKEYRGNRLIFTDSLANGIAKAQLVFIAVGTPADTNGDADMAAVEAVAREIARCIAAYKVIVVKSTVPVTTGEKLRQVLIRHGCDPTGFDVASNPEFLREGTAVTDFLFPDRIVIGTDSTRAAKLLRQAYAPLTTGAYAAAKDALPAPDGARVPARLIETSAKSAELIKHASNSFLAMKVSFINAVANLCEAVGADVGEVCEGIGADSRIGDKFLRPGIGYGGSCFPKDLLAFRAVAKSCGVDFRLLSEVMYINEQQRERFIQRVREELWVLRGKRLGVLGLAFKGGTDDLRESPAIEIVRALLKEGCELNVYDPAAMANAEKLFTSADVRFAADAYDCATDADALLILTDWDEFAELDLAHVRSVMRLPIVIDGRNLYAPTRMAKHGFHYLSVGRCEMEPQTSGISNRTNATQSSRPRRGFVDPRAA